MGRIFALWVLVLAGCTSTTAVGQSLKFRWAEGAPGNILKNVIDVRFDADSILYDVAKSGQPSAAVQARLDAQLVAECARPEVSKAITAALGETSNPWAPSAEAIVMWIQFRGPSETLEGFSSLIEAGYHNYAVYYEIENGTCGAPLNLPVFWEGDSFGSIFNK